MYQHDRAAASPLLGEGRKQPCTLGPCTQVGADMDFNSHMASTGYFNKCVDARLMLFAAGAPGSAGDQLGAAGGRCVVQMLDDFEAAQEVCPVRRH